MNTSSTLTQCSVDPPTPAPHDGTIDRGRVATNESRIPAPVYRGHNLVFIVGSPRSGTTWLQRLLASHPRVKTGQESHLFAYIGPQIEMWRKQLETAKDGHRAVGLPAYFQEDEFRSLLRHQLMHLLEPMVADLSQGDIFLEKTPSHALHAREIIELLPESRIIHVVRDARDVAASALAASRSWGSRWAPSNGRRAARQWVRHVTAARSVGVTLPATQYLEIRYEDLHRSSTATLRRAFEFIGLDMSDQEIDCIVDANSAGKVQSGGGTGIPLRGEFQNVSDTVKEPDGFVRKGRPGSWTEDLSRIEKLYIWLIARRLMHELGYSWRAPW